jgi:hypothetical protein
MDKGRHNRRGQPLIMLVAILVSWAAMRAAVWQAPFALPDRAVNEGWAYRDFAPRFIALSEPLGLLQHIRAASVLSGSDEPASAAAKSPVAAGSSRTRLAAMGDDDAFGAPFIAEPGNAHSRFIPARYDAPAAANEASVPPVAISPRVAGGHQLLLMAALVNLPLPEMLNQSLAAAPMPVSPAPRAPDAGTRRWSGDGWLLLRGNGAAVSSGPAFASYGGSQMGAVVRYHLAPGSSQRPALYLRASAALNGAPDREVAAGLSVRPLARLPVSVSAELRASNLSSNRATKARLRPAVTAVTELPQFDLPGGIKGEAYVQGGYVGGPDATAFVDGQLRAARKVVRVGAADVTAGAGVWGGAQKGAARVDVGPSVSVGVAGDHAGARLGADWRFRVAGNAAPSSGPVLTLSAGF